MATDEKVQKEVISLVQLLFEQLKVSDESNKDAIKDNTAAILELVKAMGDTPHQNRKAIELVKAEVEKRLGEKGTLTEKLDSVLDKQKTIDDKFGKLFWVFGIAMTILGIIITIFQVVDKFFPTATKG